MPRRQGLESRARKQASGNRGVIELGPLFRPARTLTRLQAARLPVGVLLRGLKRPRGVVPN